MKSYELSICIPTYNQVSHLKKTIDSLVEQTYQNFELIISDDSTTDYVRELINSYRLFFGERLSYFHNKPSLGAPKNWNYAISLSKGKWVKLMHHDDWFCVSNGLEKIIIKARQNPNSLFFSGIQAEEIDNKRRYINLPTLNKIREINLSPFTLLWANIIGPPSTILFPNMKIEFDKNLIWLVDIEFYLQLLINNKFELIYINEILFENNPGEHNITNQCFQNKSIELKEFTYIFKKYHRKPSIKEIIIFLRKLKKQIGTYDQISYFQLIKFYLKN